MDRIVGLENPVRSELDAGNVVVVVVAVVIVLLRLIANVVRFAESGSPTKPSMPSPPCSNGKRKHASKRKFGVVE